MYPNSVDHSAHAQRVISLNVGGTILKTSLQTLKSDPESIVAGELLVVLSDCASLSSIFHPLSGAKRAKEP